MKIIRDLSSERKTGRAFEDAAQQQAFPIIRSLRKEINRINSEPVVVTADVTLTYDDFSIMINANANPVTVTLPNVADAWGLIYWIKCIDSTNLVTIVGTIDGVPNPNMIAMESMIIKATRVGWWIFASN